METILVLENVIFLKIHLTHDLHFVILIKKWYQILYLQKVLKVNIEVNYSTDIFNIFSQTSTSIYSMTFN